MHRGFFLPVKVLPPVPNGPETGGGRCPATYLCGERFNSRPPWGERRMFIGNFAVTRFISIHALHGEGDKLAGKPVMVLAVFQSTPSARRATSGYSACRAGLRNFNPRPPRGGRHGKVGATTISSLFQSTPSARRATATETNLRTRQQISIHALREEGDSR